ncbi:unnamed protein product [Ascophyllum nodosum]
MHEPRQRRTEVGKRQDSVDMAGRQAGYGRRKEESIGATIDLESVNGDLLYHKNDKGTTNWRSDLSSVMLLLILYTLQGIPMGLSGSIPFLLLDKVSYSEQAIFSLVSLPFSLKLLWAPLVDSVYSRSFGRRKSWLVPSQLLCGGMMLWARSVMDDWIGEDGGDPHIKTLTAYFLGLYFIMATQDIAVDGWALTMLSRENVGYASTCNTIGQTLGFFISQVGFLALYDAGVCNKYFRSEPSDVGMLTLSTFLQFWGVVFLATTLFVWFFKPEVDNGMDDEPLDTRAHIPQEESQEPHVISAPVRPNTLNVKCSAPSITFARYVQQSQCTALSHAVTCNRSTLDFNLCVRPQLYKCVRLSSVQELTAVLLTCRMAFAVTDAATSLKLVEYGMPKEEIAMLSPILVTLGMVIPVAIGRLTAGPMPMTVFLWGYPLRIIVTMVYVWVLPLTRRTHMIPGDYSTEFVAWIVSAVVLHEVASNCMFVSQMAFFSRVSDPVIGGTYMTLLNTIANIGGKWPNSLSLYMLDHLTFRHCVTEQGDIMESVPCNSDEGKQNCQEEGASCNVWLDGYVIEAVVCTVIGLAWIGLFARRVLSMQDLPMEAWQVSIVGRKSK